MSKNHGFKKGFEASLKARIRTFFQLGKLKASLLGAEKIILLLLLRFKLGCCGLIASVSH